MTQTHKPKEESRAKQWAKEHRSTINCEIAVLFPIVLSIVIAYQHKITRGYWAIGGEGLFYALTLLWIMWIVFLIAEEKRDHYQETKRLKTKNKAQKQQIENYKRMIDWKQEIIDDQQQKIRQYESEKIEVTQQIKEAFAEKDEIKEQIKRIKQQIESKAI